MSVEPVPSGQGVPTTLRCVPLGGRLTLAGTPSAPKDPAKCAEGKATDMVYAGRGSCAEIVTGMRVFQPLFVTTDSAVS